RHDGISGIFEFFLKFLKFPFVKQQLTLSFCFMVIKGSQFIFINHHVNDIKFAINELTKRFRNTRSGGSKGFYLCSCQNQTRLELIQNLILISGSFIKYID